MKTNTYQVKSEFLVRNKKGEWVTHEQNIEIKTASSSHINVQTNNQRSQD